MSLSVAIQTSSSMKQPLYWKEGKIFKVLFTITPANTNSGANANPYVAGGDTLDLTQLFNLTSSAPGNTLPTFESVEKVEIQSSKAAPGAANLFIYNFCPGTSLANGTMQIFTGAAAQTDLTELSAKNYPTGVLADTIQAEAYFMVP